MRWPTRTRDSTVEPEAGAGDAEAGSPEASTIPCSVPFGCTSYTCGAVTTTVDAGDASSGDDGGTQDLGGTSASGPLASTVDGGSDGGGLGANEAYAFEPDDILVGSDSNLPQGAAPRTMSLWVQATANGSHQTFFNYGTFATNERFGLLEVGDREYFVGENEDLQGNVTVDDGAWHHLAVTYDGTTVTIFVDGTQDVSSTLSGDTLNTTGPAFAIGTTVSQTSREPLDGSVSDIRVYDRVLSAQEITELATLTGSNANPESLRSASSGLVFWLPLVGSSEVEPNRCGP